MLAGGWPAFWTVNGAYVMPRKPGPMRWAVPPTPMKPGSGRSLEVSCDGGDGADGGVLDDRVGLPAGVHQDGAALVAAFVGDQRADDRQVLELLGDGRQDFADLDAGGRRS